MNFSILSQAVCFTFPLITTLHALSYKSTSPGQAAQRQHSHVLSNWDCPLIDLAWSYMSKSVSMLHLIGVGGLFVFELGLKWGSHTYNGTPPHPFHHSLYSCNHQSYGSSFIERSCSHNPQCHDSWWNAPPSHGYCPRAQTRIIWDIILRYAAYWVMTEWYLHHQLRTKYPCSSNQTQSLIPSAITKQKINGLTQIVFG